MSFWFKDGSYPTALDAARAMCAVDYPITESISATVTVVTSCLSVDQTGLSGDTVRLNLARASTNNAPTAVSVQTRIPQAADVPTSGGSMSVLFWALAFVVFALGYIGGRLR